MLDAQPNGFLISVVICSALGEYCFRQISQSVGSEASVAKHLRVKSLCLSPVIVYISAWDRDWCI